MRIRQPEAVTGPMVPFDALAESGLFAPIDLQLGRLLRRLSAAEGDLVAVTGALLSRERGRGHSCLELDRWAGRPLATGSEPGRETRRWRLPDRRSFEERLAASALVGGGDDRAPLVRHRGRLYLRRYWRAEKEVAARLRQRLLAPPPEVDAVGATPASPERLRPLFRALFPATAGSEIDLQAVAAAAALASRVAVISGGPGTGKTTTVARLLALFLDADRELEIALAAPTGKAAARLGEAIADQLPALPLSPELRARIPREASTLHRLLGYQPRRDRFRYHDERPLTVDLVVIDEASMVDLLLAEALLRALPAGARLVLLGDRDQLASVETGHLFADLCAAAGPRSQHSPRFAAFYRRLAGQELPPSTEGEAGLLADAVVELRVGYRFRRRPGIGGLARAIRRRDAAGALELLATAEHDDAVGIEPPAEVGEVLEPIRHHLEETLRARSPAAALERLGRCRILCATRHGRWGVEHLNQLVEELLARRGLAVAEPWYRGRPLLVTANDYQVRLWNGDLGVCWPAEGRLRAFFPAAAGGLRSLPLARLPAHDTAWAMTIHKSQGSEFGEVLLVLPGEDLPVLSRELLYTGVTRARERVTVVGSADILRRTIARRSRRASGLAEAILGRPEAEVPLETPPAPAVSPAPAAKPGRQLSLFD